MTTPLRMLLLLIFFTSGLCALTYEVAWTRLLDHVFGVSVFATATVLATFMAGLALGAVQAGRRADTNPMPLRGYAWVELGIAVTAFLTPTVFHLIEPLYGWIFRTFEGQQIAVTVSRALLAFVALIVPATLMGATFPYMTRSLVRSGLTAGQDLGLVYGMNTLGAVVGCVAAGFVLLAHLGTTNTIYLAGAGNLVVATLATLVAKFVPPVAEEKPEALEQVNSIGGPSATASALLVLAVFASGFVSLAYEVLWFRGLLAYLYNSTYAFSLMLATFLLGIGVGGLLYAVLPLRVRSSVAFVGVLTGISGLGFWASGLIFPDLNHYAYRILGLKLLESWEAGIALIGVECALILLLPATVLGMTFPASLDLLTRSSRRFAARIGQLYSLNTVGGIGGSLAGGFVLIPLLGMRNSLLALIAAQLLLCAALVFAARRRLLALVTTGTLALVVLFAPRPPEQMFLNALNNFPHLIRIIFYKEGITDNTAVSENIETGARVVLYSDGRGTASTATAVFHKFFGHVPMLLHPNPTEVLHICFGVGNSMAAVMKHDPERVDAVELSPHVRLTAPYFWTNEGVLDDPRVHLIIEDGATYIRYAEHTYDVITLEPPELHTAGVVNLYTLDFYENAKRRLKPGGLVEQWIPASQIPERELKMLFRTFLTAFPYTLVFTQLEWTTYILVGSERPLFLDLDVLQSHWERPKVAASLKESGLESPTNLLAFFVAGQDRFWDYVGRDGPVVTDDRTWVDFMAPRSGESGFGFGMAKHPKRLDAFHRRVAEDWAAIDGLRERDPVLAWVRSSNGVDPSLQEAVAKERARSRGIR